MPEATLLHFADHGRVEGMLPRDGGDAVKTLEAVVKAGVDPAELASRLQSEGAKSFDDSWSDLLKAIDAKSHALGR
jgi:transaldolase